MSSLEVAWQMDQGKMTEGMEGPPLRARAVCPMGPRRKWRRERLLTAPAEAMTASSTAFQAFKACGRQRPSGHVLLVPPRRAPNGRQEST